MFLEDRIVRLQSLVGDIAISYGRTAVGVGWRASAGYVFSECHGDTLREVIDNLEASVLKEAERRFNDWNIKAEDALKIMRTLE